MMGVNGIDPDWELCSDYVEIDPSGRYGRYEEILGKGSSKTVYRGFDEVEGIEVAWNQVRLQDMLRSSEGAERLCCEIHLLRTLSHPNIINFHASWVDGPHRNLNFVTEMFTSGTLRQYRQKHQRVRLRAVKNWCRQILSALAYLHSHDPPIIHRDLKCDNIFINGNTGQVKIGDLGLAAILRKSHAVHCVGTPEFMAPEVYEEEYNELVDIYSFGMCVLEMVTFEYPYSECSHPVQIYKKVISGTKPDALYNVKDDSIREFIEKCLATASSRLSASELLKDPFLQTDGFGCASLDISLVSSHREAEALPWPTEGGGDGERLFLNGSMFGNAFSSSSYEEAPMDDYSWWNWDMDNGNDEKAHIEEAHRGIELFHGQEDEEPIANLDISIKGKRKDDGDIFLRLRISDKYGRVRNIYFPFDTEADTALSVATEMVAELDIIDHEVTRIADMIDDEIMSLVPDWKPGPGIDETPGLNHSAYCHNCKSNVSSCGSLLDYLNLQSAHCTNVDCTAMHLHGRFEEITYQVENPEPEHEPESNCHEEIKIVHIDGFVAENEPGVHSLCSNGTEFANSEVNNVHKRSLGRKPSLGKLQSFHVGTTNYYRAPWCKTKPEPILERKRCDSYHVRTKSLDTCS